jgi:outer membrane protein assembly factor BamA
VGNQSVSNRIIDRALTYRPGDLYRRRVVLDSQRRLYGMELFQFVNVETVDSPQLSPEVRTRVTVAEGNHQRVNFGIGYGTEERARVDAEYHHVNFLGGARSAGVHGRWSSLDRGLRFDFNQPYLFSPRLSFGAEGQHWFTTTPSYDSTVTGGKATVTRRGLPNTSLSFSVLSEFTSSSITEAALNDPTLRDDLIALGLNPVTGKQEGTLNAVAFDVNHSIADNLLNTTRGYQLAFHAENAGRLLPGTFRYFALSGDARLYLPIGRRIVTANRLQIATIDAAADEPGNVPFSKKYFLGGATTMRGWGRYEVSPLSSGLPIGGNTLFELSSEARVPLVGRLGGVLFFDAGNVWEGSWSVDVNDLRYDAGFGLRYQTPIGPIRFDVGYQLNPIDELLVDGAPQERAYRLHFSIGQAF